MRNPGKKLPGFFICDTGAFKNRVIARRKAGGVSRATKQSHAIQGEDA